MASTAGVDLRHVPLPHKSWISLNNKIFVSPKGDA